MDESVQLRRFAPSELYLTPDDANSVLRFYFETKTVPIDQLTQADVAFAQSILLEGIDKSYAMGYIKILFECFFMKIPGTFESIRKLAVDFVAKAAKHWFRHATGKDLEQPKIYENIRSMIIGTTRADWIARVDGYEGSSMGCYLTNEDEGSARRMEFSRATQERALRRQKNRCGMCGETITALGTAGCAGHRFGELANAHHIKHAKEGGSNDESNCVILCRACHINVHEGGRWRSREIEASPSDFDHYNG
jgi:hypothetical protein